MNRRNKKKEKKKIYILLLLLLTLAIGIGYAILSEILQINSTVNIDSIKWNVGFVSASDGGGTIKSNPTVSQDKKTITISCNLGSTTKTSTCIANATIENASTFAVQLAEAPTITYDNTYISSVAATWTSNSATVAASDTINANTSKEIQIKITTKELSKDALPSTSVSIPITVSMNWVEGENESLKILSIGNSFSVDSLEYVYQIAQDLGYTDVKLGNLYIGGCSLATHLSNAQNDSAKYTYYTNTDGTWKTTNSYKISTAVKSEDWDWITFQQASPNSGQADTYDDLNSLMSIVETMSGDAQFAWHMTWAYQQDSTHTGFANYSNDQMTMYNAIVNAVQTKIAPNEKIVKILPAGTAIQNARTSYLGDTITRDGYHLSYNEGRYISGVTFLKGLTGINVDGLTYKPEGVSDVVRQIAIEVANTSIERPFRVTQSQFTTLPPAGYQQLDLKLKEEAYYDSASTAGKEPQELILGQWNNSQFMASGKIYSKAELPVGTIIELASGFQYRPDGWTNGVGCATTAERPANVTASQVIVDSNWWGSYTERAFNIGSITGDAISDSNRADFYKALKVYVPINDTAGYERVQLQLTKSAYYCTLVNYPTPPTLTTRDIYAPATNDIYFYATQVFTKETLPVGSIIEIASGWQYRAEGWDSSNFQSQTAAERSPNVTTQQVTVDEAWWGDYTARGFNIALKGGSTDISGYSESQINEAFKIYVPKSN